MGIDTYMCSNFIVFCSLKSKISGFFFGWSLASLVSDGWFMFLSILWFSLASLGPLILWFFGSWFSLVDCSPLVWSLVSSFERRTAFHSWYKTTFHLNLSVIQKYSNSSLLNTLSEWFNINNWCFDLILMLNVNSTLKLKNYRTDVMIITHFFFAIPKWLLHSQCHAFFHSFTLTATFIGHEHILLQFKVPWPLMLFKVSLLLFAFILHEILRFCFLSQCSCSVGKLKNSRKKHFGFKFCCSTRKRIFLAVWVSVPSFMILFNRIKSNPLLSSNPRTMLSFFFRFN